MPVRMIYEGAPASLLPAVTTLSRVFLDPDPEKIAAMRRAGVSEKEIGTTSSDYARLCALASSPEVRGDGALARRIRKELRFFGCEKVFSPETVKAVWEETKDAFLPYDPTPLVPDRDVFAVLTDAADPPELAGGFVPAIDLTPAFAFSSRGFSGWTGKILPQGTAFSGYADAIGKRIAAFAGCGCDTAVLRLPRLPLDLRAEEEDLNRLFLLSVARDGCATGKEDLEKLRTALLLRVCASLRSCGMTLHLRFGAEEKNGMRLPLPDAGMLYEMLFLLSARNLLPPLVLCPESAYAEEAAPAIASLLPARNGAPAAYVASDSERIPTPLRARCAIPDRFGSALRFLQ